ncbi:orofacial cleft 1 candidate gene 1 protein [Sarcophilus harrisii]|uniref:orofacial cleft 1 candidate gene 1 protein n=1 Tax=Sarcophilus harrisii TaxID=9305 RepID=UPI001301AFCE|nr:orofacial cleft 1 candidate gene 1 protein [Sarcophilus harrisii]
MIRTVCKIHFLAGLCPPALQQRSQNPSAWTSSGSRDELGIVLTISLQKFQQKALKQTKQKKSKSAEFLMAKEDGAATESIENPAFNISSTDLSAYQTSEEKVIKHDKPDSTLAAHPQKLGLRDCAEPRGVISILIMLTLSDSCCVSDLTWAFHS